VAERSTVGSEVVVLVAGLDVVVETLAPLVQAAPSSTTAMRQTSRRDDTPPMFS